MNFATLQGRLLTREYTKCHCIMQRNYCILWTRLLFFSIWYIHLTLINKITDKISLIAITLSHVYFRVWYTINEIYLPAILKLNPNTTMARRILWRSMWQVLYGLNRKFLSFSSIVSATLCLQQCMACTNLETNFNNNTLCNYYSQIV